MRCDGEGSSVMLDVVWVAGLAQGGGVGWMFLCCSGHNANLARNGPGREELPGVQSRLKPQKHTVALSLRYSWAVDIH